jgi:molecular chaperone Hsp33
MDKICKAVAFDGQISVVTMKTTNLVQKARDVHGLSPVCTAALGRALAAVTFMSAGLKDKDGKLSVTIRGNGKGGEIVVCGNANLQMRGSIEHPDVELPPNALGKLDVSGCVGTEGRMTVVRSMGLKEPYTGSAKLVSGELAEDFAAYYTYSEQQPTAMALGVLVGTDGNVLGAGGVIIQPLPGCSEQALVAAESVLPKLANVSAYFSNHTAEEAMQEFFGLQPLETRYPKYECLCSRDYIERLLLSLGKAECEDILKEQGKIHISCQFCNTVYSFDEKDVTALFGGANE